MSNLDNLDINDEWREKFELFQSIGTSERFIFDAIKTKEGKQLDAEEKSSLTFNIYAFFLGPFYYFLKQMWYKGIVILSMTIILSLISILIVKLLQQPVIIGIGFTIIIMLSSMLICAKLANYDYFKFWVDEIYIWEPFRFFSNPFLLFLFPIIIIILCASIMIALLLPFTPACNDKKVIQMVNGLKRAQYAQVFGQTVMHQVSTSLHAIKMDNIDYKTGVKTCEGTFNVTNQSNNNTSIYNTIYLIENTKDGKNFYVALKK